MNDGETCGSQVQGIKVVIKRFTSSTVYLFKEIAGACRGLRKLAARHNDNRFLIRTDCKFHDLYLVVLVLRIWADRALELGQAHQHTVLAGSALRALVGGRRFAMRSIKCQ